MPRYKAVIAYDGTDFCGFQIQANGRTVQDELEKTLFQLNRGNRVVVCGSGRTDSGVHALGQVVHFDYPAVLSLEKFRYALDTQTPPDIAVKQVELADDDFHARYLVTEKTYQFKLDIGKPRNPLKRKYTSFYPYSLDLALMQISIQDLIGTHDFSAFCASGSTIENKVRTIYDAKIEHLDQEEELVFTFRGNGFLYKMVRIMVGTLIKIGNGRLPVDAIPPIFVSKNRNLAGPTAHSEGLYLVKVSYE